MRKEEGIVSLLALFLIVSIVSVGAYLHFNHPNLKPKNYKVSAQTPPKPNIVFILTDDQRFEHLQNMPYLSSKPNGHWIEFSNSFLSFPLCCPSRSTILSGLYSHHHGINNNTDAAKLMDAALLPTWLKTGGYNTALIGKYLNAYPFPDRPSNYIPPGWDNWFAVQGSNSYYNLKINDNGTITQYGASAADYSTDLLAGKAINFLNSATEPFFLFYTPPAPHDPFTPAIRHKGFYKTLPITHSPNYNEADVSDKPLWVRNLPLLTDAQVLTQDNHQRAASETLLAVDESIKQIIDTLSAKGILDNTIIIFMTDNGYGFGNHRWENKECEFEECIKTPLLVRYPWTDSRIETRFVENVDFASTLAEIAGVTPPYTTDGVSLVPLFNNTPPGNWRTNLLLRGGAKGAKFYGIRTDSWKYIDIFNSQEKELYDLVNDPYELNNLAGNPDYATTQSQLAADLDTLKNSNKDTVLPTITINSPVSGATVSGVVPITTTASDNWYVSQVTFTVDTTQKNTDVTPPYAYNWNSATVPNGTHTLKVKVSDGGGNTTTSSTTVTVAN